MFCTEMRLSTLDPNRWISTFLTMKRWLALFTVLQSQLDCVLATLGGTGARTFLSAAIHGLRAAPIRHPFDIRVHPCPSVVELSWLRFSTLRFLRYLLFRTFSHIPHLSRLKSIQMYLSYINLNTHTHH